MKTISKNDILSVIINTQGVQLVNKSIFIPSGIYDERDVHKIEIYIHGDEATTAMNVLFRLFDFKETSTTEENTIYTSDDFKLSIVIWHYACDLFTSVDEIIVWLSNNNRLELHKCIFELYNKYTQPN